MYNLEKLMHTAIEEARISLREGNSGFGALIIKGLVVISKAHDTDKISGDPTQHAEMNVIRSAAAKLGRDLSDCVLISTHDPARCAQPPLYGPGFLRSHTDIR
jgi:tRNA(Arg) A34 adenosine deaminase TadA